MELDITSTANPKLKWLDKLHKSSQRRNEGLFLVEGFKEISYALQAGLAPHSLFIAPDITGNTPVPPIRPAYRLATKCYEKVAYRSGSDGMIAVFHEPIVSLNDLKLSPNPFVIILEAVEKPGNLGAIVRTADGTQADAVIICDEKTDIWNPNAIRASVGTIFSTPVVSASQTETKAWLARHGITAFAAALTDTATAYTQKDFTKPTALLLGTEADGLSTSWLQDTEHIVIPMLGKNDSLNVSVAAGILAYEVVRQRQL